MRRYLTYRPLEASRIFRMLDLVAHGPLVMRQFICSLFLLPKLGLPGIGSSRAGFVLLSLTIRMLTRADSVFSERYFLRPADLYNYLSLPTCGKEVKCCWNGFL